MAEEIKCRDSVLGIDIGSETISMAEMDMEGNILRHYYQFHKGNIPKALEDADRIFNLKSLKAIGCTGSLKILNASILHQYNTQVAIMTATRKLCSNAASVLHIGAERFMLIRFGKNLKYESTKTNTSCAAGTGSFLDQQADRLNLSGIEELCERALQNRDDIPFIASRCSVFANTDIIHAQQRGFSINSICNSLCKGLAENVISTVFSREAPPLPLIMSGGVSKNQVVRRYLEEDLKTEFLVNPLSHLFGAIGAGLLLLSEKEVRGIKINSCTGILLPSDNKKQYFHKPLKLELSKYPDFSCEESYRLRPVVSAHTSDVEVDIYMKKEKDNNHDVYLGIDIGSTSTKAILIDIQKNPVAGFYTYTGGKPLSAVKSIFESIDNLVRRGNAGLNILGVGTTGSGRKFIGNIIGAGLIVDEITSHARAAYELNPATDTIVEIGGQDAKFTLMHEGNVTFSQMNTVCAAGTGSFLHEQAKKLGCSLSDYAEKAGNAGAPLASDRCAVFMERDINQLINNGYTVSEILATALHSVTENYLQKVANEGAVGKHICFQGATARNRSLVAAFEQRLKKPVFVSKYCHLTGALGTALIMHEQQVGISGFRGIGLFRESIPVETETCSLCNNKCCISLASVGGEKVAYGFMCGRDYETDHFISKNKTGLDMAKVREKLFSLENHKTCRYDVTIGIPSSLHMFEELPMWKRFFSNLSVPVVTSEGYRDPVKTGKSLAGAEFCAPISSIFGHAVYLSDKVDYLFLPVLLQNREKIHETESQFCYYTQFSSSLVYTLKVNNIPAKCLSPLLSFPKGNYHVAQKLYQCLKPVLKNGLSYLTVLNAFSEALSWYSARKQKLTGIFANEFRPETGISVALLGRPYIVLSKSLNKGIPDIFSSLGIKSFYQDMISADNTEMMEINTMVKEVPWYFVTKILETAETIAKTKNLYPVLITAFKCAPDSFIIEYFKRIFNSCKKPYLILQIDEHDSNIGYETRIEAAVRSFKNHAASKDGNMVVKAGNFLPRITRRIEDKTLMLPSWDPIVSPLLVANLRRIGIDARLMKSSELIIRKSMAHNTGQCLPINIIAQEFIDYTIEHDLKPEDTMLWIVETKLSCNIRLYPQYIKSILENYGHGLEKAHVYSGLLTHLEISLSACYYAYFAYQLGGLIRMTACKIRPYELNKGETDNVIEKSVGILEKAFLGKESMENAVREIMALFDKIPKAEGNRPKVAIFGDFYVCDNEIMNQKLYHTIEEAGGEVITTTYADFVRMSLDNMLRRTVYRGEYFTAAQQRLISSILKLLDDKYYRYFEKYLGPKKPIIPRKLEKNLSRFNINPYNSGESYYNILKVFYFLENYQDIALFVQANPAFCCPALVTEAMTGEIRRITGVPVVSLTYDGTNEYKNDVVIPYLHGANIV